MNQEVGNLLKFRRSCQIQNVVAAIMQLVAILTHSTDGRVTGRCARKGDRLLRLKRGHFLAFNDALTIVSANLSSG